jgi:CDP-6-deoxy-D-xylo-4-hexulose-3-dehydrase
VEGGIVATNDRDLYNILLAVRSHGWARDMEPEYREKYRKEWDIDEFNELYTFYHSGFNLRATDFQAFLGIRQLERIDEIIDIREKNYQCYMRNVTNDTWKPNIDENSLVSNYCYPMIVSDREKLCNALASESIETRPLIAGSMALQPFHIKKYGNHHLPNAERVHKNGLYLPNYHNLKEEEIEYISTVVNRIIG